MYTSTYLHTYIHIRSTPFRAPFRSQSVPLLHFTSSTNRPTLIRRVQRRPSPPPVDAMSSTPTAAAAAVANHLVRPPANDDIARAMVSLLCLVLLLLLLLLLLVAVASAFPFVYVHRKLTTVFIYSSFICITPPPRAVLTFCRAISSTMRAMLRSRLLDASVSCSPSTPFLRPSWRGKLPFYAPSLPQ